MQNEELKASEARYRLLAENSTDVIGIVGTDGVVRYASPSCRSLTGYEQDEMIGLRVSELYLPEDRPVVENALARHAAGEPVVRVRYRIRRKDGELVWVERITRAIRNPGSGEIVEFQFSVRDVTETKRAEDEVVRHGELLEELVAERTATLLSSNSALMESVEANRRTEKELRESEERLRLAQEVGQSGTWEWSLRTDDFVSTAELRRLYGLSEEDSSATLSAVRMLVHADDLSLVDALVRGAVEDRTGFQGEFRIVRPDGELRWMEAVGRVFFDDAGLPLRLIGLTRDVTDRKRIEEALRASESRYRRIVETAHEGIWQLDAEAKTTFVNRRMEEILGYTLEEMLGQTPLAFMAEEERSDAALRIEESKQGVPDSFERRLLSKEGADVWVRLTRSPLRSPEGAFAGILTMVTDITKRKEADAAILRLNTMLEQRVSERTAELEAANRELEAFSFSVSHDLRAPLWAIAGFSRTIAEDYGPILDAEGRRRLELVRTSVLRQVRLVDDLLSFSRIGRTEMRHSRMKMGEMARSAFEEVLGDPAARRRIDFRVGALPEASGDAALMWQAWINLLSNAVKFSATKERPRIRVEGNLAKGEAVYRVRDNGVGFDMADVGKLFGVFQRLHSEEEFPGTGIGLSLVRRIVERHGGRVWAEGAVGVGATFSFSLPVKKEPGTTAPPA